MMPRRLVAICTAAWVTVAMAAGGAGRASAVTAPPRQPVRSCESLATVALTHTTVLSATAVTSGTVGPITGLPAFCDVVLTVTHPPAGDQVKVEVWLPSTTWNGRYQGTGGGGFAGGSFAVAL